MAHHPFGRGYRSGSEETPKYRDACLATPIGTQDRVLVLGSKTKNNCPCSARGAQTQTHSRKGGGRSSSSSRSGEKSPNEDPGRISVSGVIPRRKLLLWEKGARSRRSKPWRRNLIGYNRPMHPYACGSCQIGQLSDKRISRSDRFVGCVRDVRAGV